MPAAATSNGCQTWAALAGGKKIRGRRKKRKKRGRGRKEEEEERKREERKEERREGEGLHVQCFYLGKEKREGGVW